MELDLSLHKLLFTITLLSSPIVCQHYIQPLSGNTAVSPDDSSTVWKYESVSTSTRTAQNNRYSLIHITWLETGFIYDG